MNDELAIDETLITAVLKDHFPDAQAIYLFGSYATGEAWPTSDVDLAMLLPVGSTINADFFAISEAAAELSLAVGAEVDLVSLRDVETILQAEIILHGRRLGVFNEGAADLFEVQVMKAFQNLRQERAEIVADGLATGRFYQRSFH